MSYAELVNSYLFYTLYKVSIGAVYGVSSIWIRHNSTLVSSLLEILYYYIALQYTLVEVVLRSTYL